MRKAPSIGIANRTHHQQGLQHIRVRLVVNAVLLERFDRPHLLLSRLEVVAKKRLELVKRLESYCKLSKDLGMPGSKMSRSNFYHAQCLARLCKPSAEPRWHMASVIK
jgi:hypothetical protein